MDRKGFLKSTMIATGSLLLGGAGICRFLNDKEPADGPFPRTIEKIHCGNMKKVLVIMSAGTKLGNTDRLTDAYIKVTVKSFYRQALRHLCRRQVSAERYGITDDSR